MSSKIDNGDVAGFTLVEFVTIIIVLSILSAVAIPKFFTTSSYKGRAVYDEVAAALRYGQKLAVASGCEVQVSFTATGYSLQQRSSSCSSGSFTTITDHPISTETFTDSTIASSPTSFIFDALGRSSNAATIVVDGAQITVTAATGYVAADAF